MAYVLPLSLYTVPDPMQSQTVLGFVQDYAPGYIGAESAQPNDASAKAGNGVFAMAPVGLPGAVAPTFYNDWYFRIHFVPSSLQMGNLLSNQTRSVVVWNAYFQSVPASSFALAGDAGITVQEPMLTPYSMAPIGLYTYTVTVSTVGPPAINATMTWTIDGVDYIVPVTGRRVVVFGFKPNWSNPVDETLEWATAIETAFDRSEHRIEQREEPRRILEYAAQVVGPETGLFENALFGWADRLFALPLWPEVSTLTAPAAIGATAISLDTADRSYVADGLLVIFQSAAVFEAIEIESVSSDAVTLKKGTERAWPVGTRVYPVMVSRLDGGANVRYIAEDKLELPVRFVGSPAEAPTRLPDVAPAITFNGVEVYTQGTNWISGVGVNVQADVDLLDAPSGVFSMRQRSGWPTIVKEHEWLNKTRAEQSMLRAFLKRRAGRLAPVWMPTGTADFKLLADVVQTDTTLLVEDNGYAVMIDGHPARRHVLIQLRGGTNIVREIDNVAPQGDGTANLTLTAAVGVGFTRKQLRRISYLGLYRLASDAVTISHRTTGASVVQTSLQLTRPAP